MGEIDILLSLKPMLVARRCVFHVSLLHSLLGIEDALLLDPGELIPASWIDTFSNRAARLHFTLFGAAKRAFSCNVSSIRVSLPRKSIASSPTSTAMLLLTSRNEPSTFGVAYQQPQLSSRSQESCNKASSREV